MINKFWESLGQQLADRWMGQIFGPSFFFWTGGAFAWIYANGWESALKLFTSLSIEIRIMVLIVALLAILFSASLIQLLVTPTRHFLEGQWPFGLRKIRSFIINAQKRQLHRTNDRWYKLMKKMEEAPLEMTESERIEFAKLELILHKTPYGNLTPTRFGNIQRASENSIRAKYGLDVFVTLPRLKLLLPDLARQDLISTLQTIDSAVNIFLWGFLFLIWSVFSLWAIPVSILVMFSAYTWALSAAETYTQSLESCYDLYHFKLYEALRRPAPENAKNDFMIGQEVNEFLWRGTSMSNSNMVYIKPPSKVDQDK